MTDPTPPRADVLRDERERKRLVAANVEALRKWTLDFHNTKWMRAAINIVLDDRAALVRQLAATKGELDEARKDRERIEWHEKHRNVVSDHGEWMVWHRGEWRRTRSFTSLESFKTWRDAVDYAMSEPPALRDGGTDDRA